MDVFQSSKSTLEAENAELFAKVSKLTDDLRKSQEELTGLAARNDTLSQEALSKVKYAERQQKLLATDHDIRDILGSRSLHIIDVYDVSGQGELERPFGRIFYTEGKSLIFYAFDLDLQKSLKRGAVFQAWIAIHPRLFNHAGLGRVHVEVRVLAEARDVVIADQGQAIIFTTRYRPVKGSRGYYRVNLRHGVSRVHRGTRYTLGIIFHDAK